MSLPSDAIMTDVKTDANTSLNSSNAPNGPAVTAATGFHRAPNVTTPFPAGYYYVPMQFAQHAMPHPTSAGSSLSQAAKLDALTKQCQATQQQSNATEHRTEQTVSVVAKMLEMFTGLQHRMDSVERAFHDTSDRLAKLERIVSKLIEQPRSAPSTSALESAGTCNDTYGTYGSVLRGNNRMNGSGKSNRD